jgi:hypothetical protein
VKEWFYVIEFSVYVNAPELFVVGGVSCRVIIVFLNTVISEGKINGPKDLVEVLVYTK